MFKVVLTPLSMVKIVLLSCVSKKLPGRAKAQDLYISPLFCYGLRYARSLKPDKIFILSAKYGLVGLNDVIDTYNLSLNSMGVSQIKLWSDGVLEQLRLVSDLHNDTFIFLAGDRYRKYLLSHINHYEIPLQGLGLGRQLQFLKGSA